MSRALRVGDVVIRFGYSDHFRGKITETLPRRIARVLWQNGQERLEEKSDLLRVVGAPWPPNTEEQS